MSLLTRAIISNLEKKAETFIQMGYKAKPEERMFAQNQLRKIVESLDFFSAPKDCFMHYLSAYNVLSIHLFNPEEIAEECLDLFILPGEINKELNTVKDERAKKRSLLSYILDESYLMLSEQKPTLEITPQDAHYLKLIQSMARVDMPVASGYAEVYNRLAIIKSVKEKSKQIVQVGSHNEFGIALERL